MTELSDDSMGHTLQKNLQYIRDVYCAHPMIIDLLDEFERLQKEVEELEQSNAEAAERDSQIDYLIPWLTQ